MQKISSQVRFNPRTIQSTASHYTNSANPAHTVTCALWNTTVIQQSACSYESVEITNKMQPCNRIYYSNIYWRLNMFRAAHHPSTGAQNGVCSLWFAHTCGDRPLSSLSGKWLAISHSGLTTASHFPLRLDNGRSPHVYVNQRLPTQF